MKPLRDFFTCTSLLRGAAILVLAGLISLPANSAEFKKGQKVWSKNYETPLLAEPRPLATVVARVGFAEKLSVRESQGSWLRVKSGEGEGWVFQGNIADEKPSLAPGAGWTTVEASQTDTVAAARPLEPAAKGYAQRHGAGDAEADIDWLDVQAAVITHQDIIVYMSAGQLGEYQE
ncbi:MAG: hypothetical protein MUP31_05150 [Xanthomonadales bacterium]|nr:hypothetical protein [Xanthomonadales bacterium]